jgi:thioredoxin 1
MTTIKHFTATWCQPCKNLSPIMRDLINKYPRINYQMIDVDDNSETASRLGIKAVPTVIFESNGQEVQRVMGLHTFKYYEEIIFSNNL